MADFDLEKQSQESLPQTPISRIQTKLSDGREVVSFGNTRVYKDELVTAFGGDFNPNRYSVPTQHKFANPAPLGLSGFAMCLFVLSLFNCGARGIAIDNLIVGLAYFYGGAVLILTGMWCMVVENAFGGLVFSSYGAFWISYATIFTDAFGIQAAYADAPEQLSNSLGIYMLAWTLFSVMVTVCTIRSTVAFFSVFLTLDITFLLLTIAEFTGSAGCVKGAGVIGVICAFLAWYNAFAGIATKENCHFVVKEKSLP